MTTLNDALLAIIQKTQGAVEGGIAFLSEQIPDVLQQLLLWHLFRSAFLGLMAAATLYLFYRLVRWAVTHKFEDPSNRDPAIGLSSAGAVISSFVCLPALVYQSLTVIQIWVAPKIFLIEYAASLVK